MAADSAVTVGDDLKIFNTVNKLFALSKRHPVGIMVYSSAHVMEVPVETVVKEFRRARPDADADACAHLEDHADAFEKYLRDNNKLFPDDAREEAMVRLANLAIDRVSGLAGKKLQEKMTGWGHPTEAEAKAALAASIAELELEIKKAKKIVAKGFAKMRGVFAAKIDGNLTAALARLKQDIPVTKKQEASIKRIAVDSLLTEVRWGGETGFVIAGFGNDDVYPRLRSFEFYYSASGVTKVLERTHCDIDRKHTAQIIPFAQKDVMATFVEGRDPSYKRWLVNFLEGFFEEQKSQLSTTVPPNPSGVALVSMIEQKLKKEIERSGLDFTRHYFIFPLMAVVSSMPKEELALLAEALINLTSLKRKASYDAESVGGPTDVAIISKGDGFIWIKRKHYFDPKLNPGFGTV